MKPKTSTELMDQLLTGEPVAWEQKLFCNEFIVAGHPKREEQILARYRDGAVTALLGEMESVSGIVALNEKQRMALRTAAGPGNQAGEPGRESGHR